jgi:hypothetical protein
VYIRQEQGEWVCLTHSPNKVCIFLRYTGIYPIKYVSTYVSESIILYRLWCRE